MAVLLVIGCSSSNGASDDGGTDSTTTTPDRPDSGSRDASQVEGGPQEPPSTWPSSNNTGYEHAPGYPGALTRCEGPIESGHVYEFCDFADGLAIGDSDHHPTNVTFIGCRFASNELVAGDVTSYADGISFDYCTFEPNKVAAPPTAYDEGYQFGLDLRTPSKTTVDHCNFWGWANGISFEFSSEDKPLVVKNSFFHDARADGGVDHTDAILSNNGGPEYAVFDHNTITSRGNTNGLALQVVDRPYNHITITNNYFSGFGATVNTGGALLSRNMTFTGNTFGTDIEPLFRPLYADECWVTKGLDNVWRMNKWRVAPGGYSSKVEDDGKYWLPDGTLSATDYEGP